MDVVSHREIIRHNVQEADHLAEDEDSVAVLLEPMEEFVKEDHLSAGHDDSLELFVPGLRRFFASVEEVRMVCDFLQLHRWENLSEDCWDC